MKKILFILLFTFLVCCSVHAQWYPSGYNETMGVHDLYFLNGKTGFAVGFHQVYKTIDAGDTWSEIADNIFINGPNCIWFFNEATGIIVGESGGEPQVGKTINGGLSWTVTTLPTGMGFYSPNQILFTDNNTGYIACRSGKIYKTVNQGSNWTELTTGTTDDITSIHFPSATVGYATLMYSDKLLKTINGGTSWSQINIDQLREVNHVYFTDINTGYLACGKSTILKTSDGGNSWTSFSFGTNDMFHTMEFTSAQKGYTAGSAGTIAQTTDAGTTWTTIFSGLGSTNNLLYSMDFPNADTGYVATLTSGIILRTTNGGGINSVGGIKEKFDLNIYPNPASDVLYITATNAIYELTYYITDQLGRVVLSGNLTEKTIQIDINQLTVGVYLFQIGEQKKKFLKVKNN
ncbi:MAG: YCF48-related protein [Bacteroidales bacterium]|nr:YCF48-related protein [Bacteroidales bacterium]MDT8430683.1 YCF48-related protein [Bacteroidales bacterium]